jgi:hypothetical protein
MNTYKNITILGLLFFAFANAAFAQSEQLAQAHTPEYHKVPALTGDATKDAEIQKVAAQDLARYEMYREKMYTTLGGKFNAAQTAYAKSVGMPEFTYSGVAENDWQQYKDAFKRWAKANEPALPAIQQKFADLAKQ